MADYPGGSDLSLGDKHGAKFSLVWTRRDGELGAEIAVNDGHEIGQWSSFDADRDQLIKLSATIICGLSSTGETIERIIAALAPAQRAAGSGDALPTCAGDVADSLVLTRDERELLVARIEYLIARAERSALVECGTIMQRALVPPLSEEETRAHNRPLQAHEVWP